MFEPEIGKEEPTLEEQSLAWVNRVREALGKPTLAELPEWQRDLPSMDGNPVAQAIGARTYRFRERPLVIADVADKDYADAIVSAGNVTIDTYRPVAGETRLRYDLRLPAFLWDFAGAAPDTRKDADDENGTVGNGSVAVGDGDIDADGQSADEAQPGEDREDHLPPLRTFLPDSGEDRPVRIEPEP